MALTSFGDYLCRASVHRITPQHSQECSKLLQIILILEHLFTDNPYIHFIGLNQVTPLDALRHFVHSDQPLRLQNQHRKDNQSTC